MHYPDETFPTLKAIIQYVLSEDRIDPEALRLFIFLPTNELSDLDRPDRGSIASSLSRFFQNIDVTKPSNILDDFECNDDLIQEAYRLFGPSPDMRIICQILRDDIADQLKIESERREHNAFWVRQTEVLVSLLDSQIALVSLVEQYVGHIDQDDFLSDISGSYLDKDELDSIVQCWSIPESHNETAAPVAQ